MKEQHAFRLIKSTIEGHESCSINQDAQIGDQEARLKTLIERWKPLQSKYKLMRLSKKSMMINKSKSIRLLQDKDLKEITKDSISGRIEVLKYSLSAIVTVKCET